jgi:hypothetical protein
MMVSHARQFDSAADNASADARLDECVQRLYEVLAYEGAMRWAGREFLDACASLDRQAIVRRAAERWRGEHASGVLSLDGIEAAFRADLARLFHWDNIDDAEGSA